MYAAQLPGCCGIMVLYELGGSLNLHRKADLDRYLDTYKYYQLVITLNSSQIAEGSLLNYITKLGFIPVTTGYENPNTGRPVVTYIRMPKKNGKTIPSVEKIHYVMGEFDSAEWTGKYI
jgi:hypothetical protein